MSRAALVSVLRKRCASAYRAIEEIVGRAAADEWEGSILEETPTELRSALARAEKLLRSTAFTGNLR